MELTEQQIKMMEKTRVKRLLGNQRVVKDPKTGIETRLRSWVDHYFSTILVGTGTGIPASSIVKFFQNPSNYGTIAAAAANQPTGDMKENIRNGEPNSGETWRLLRVLFEARLFTPAASPDDLTNAKLLDLIERHPFLVKIVSGGDTEWTKPKPLSFFLAKDSSIQVHAPKLSHGVVGGYSLHDAPIIFGDNYPVTIELHNRGVDFVSPVAGVDILMRAIMQVEIIKPYYQEN